MDIVKEFLDQLGIAREWHLPLMLLALILVFFSGIVVTRTRQWLEWYLRQNYKYVDVQLNYRYIDKDGRMKSRFDSVGLLVLEEALMWEELATEVRKAARRTGRGVAAIILPDEEAHATMLNKLAGAAGRLPALILRGQASGDNEFLSCFVCETFIGIPRTLKLMLDTHYGLVEIQNPDIQRELKDSRNLEFAHHRDRIDTLVEMASFHLEQNDGTTSHLTGNRRVIRSVRVGIPHGA